MARVPLQTGLNQELAIGSNVQLGAGTVEPMRDVVSDDITRNAQALQQAGQIIQKLDDELNDAESRRLYNNFTADLNAISQEYLNKEGYNAVQVVNQEDGSITRAYDVANGKIESLLGKYQNDASNGVVKFMFENMASVAVKNKQTLMTQHSIKQQNLMLTKETTIAIDNHKNGAIENYASWNDEDGIFKVELESGAELIKEQAIREGLNVQVGPNGEPISPIYLDRLSKYYMGVHEEVINRFKEEKKFGQLKLYLASIDPNGDNEVTLKEIKEKIKKEHDDYNGEILVNAIINNNSPTDYSFTNQAGILEGLSSNNNSDNNNGGVVTSGFNSNEVLVEDYSQTERLGILEKERNKSIFYQADSKKTLVPQHQITHLFAIQKLGVEKADSLYTKAYNQVKFDKEKYKNNFDYKQKIDGKILDKYNEFVIANVRRKYFLFDGTYADQVSNDLEVLKNNVSYVDIKTSDIVNPITGLQPIEVYKEKLKSTITNADQLATATKDLEIKYNAIVEEKTTAYNNNLANAQEIAFAKEGGWKDLAANNIDINNFTEEDQQKLKNGPPTESDEETIAELIDKPEEVRDNVDAYRFKLSNTDFLKLKRLSEDYKNEDKYIEASGNKDLMKDVMFKNGYDWVYKPKFGGNSADFGAIHTEWVDRIDYAQQISGKKLTRQQKVEILNNVLMDKVNLQGTFGFGKKTDKLTSTVMPDRLDDLFVKVKVKQEDGSFKTEQIFTSEIPKEISVAIMGSLYRRKLPMNQKNIAEEWVKFGRPKTLLEAEEFINANLNYQLAPESLK